MNPSVVELAIPGTQPEYHFPPYLSSIPRSPRMPLVLLPETLTEKTGPVFGHGLLRERDNDLTAQHAGDPIGERIVVHGRVLDEDGRPVRGALVEVWQANASGRYRHKVDTHDAPLDPNFSGAGRTLTDEHGHYWFKTVKPGAYPWGNHYNAWRPAHIHFSLFGAGILVAAGNPDVFSGRPLAAAGSNLQQHSQMRRRGSALFRGSIWSDRSPITCWRTPGTLFCGEEATRRLRRGIDER